VGDDIRMMGGTLNVNGNVADDVMAVGGEFTIADGATIRGSVWSVAGEMSLYGQINEELTSWLGKGRIDGLVGGDAEIHISEGLSFGNNGKIGESLRYWAPREDPTLVNYAKNVEFNQAVDPNASTRGLIALLTIAGLTAVLWKWLSFLLLGSIIIWLLPKYFPQIIDTMKAQKNTAMYIWNGLLVMIVAPVLAMLFAITVVGIPVASVIFLAYGLLIVFGAIAGAYGIGSYLRQHSHK